MGFQNRKIRYLYWFIIEYFKKHFKLIFLSALISTIFIISAITVFPYLIAYLTPQNTIIGYVGSYDYDNLPDEIASKISNGLVYVNDNSVIVPVLCESWEMKDNGLTYRMHIKKNILLDDNTFFSAKDVVSAYKNTFRDIAISTPDTNIVEFRLKKSLAIFPTYLTKPIIKYPFIGVGGLYKVNHFKQKYGKLVEMNITPVSKNGKNIIYKFFANESQMINAYKLGQITEMTITKKTIADIFLQWKNTTVTKNIDYSSLLVLFFNYNNPFLNEREVRSAIRMSIDQSQFSNLGLRANTSIPPSSWAYNDDLKEEIYDSELARKIIKKYKSGSESAKLNFNTYYDYLDIADEINKDLNDIGLNTNLNIVSYSATHNFDLMLAFLKIPVDPDQYYYWHSTQKLGTVTGYKNLKVDKLLEDGRSLYLKKSERLKFYLDMQKYLDDDNAAVFFYYPYNYTIKRK